MSHADKARAAWGADLPDWVRVLAERADALGSQNKVAAEIGYSAAAVSTIIGNTYAARDISALEMAVRATIMAETVACPVFGETSLAQCLDWRASAARPFRALSSLHSQMRDACGVCAKNGGRDAQ